MHNINFIRENATAFDNAMKQRGETPCSVKIIKIDEEKRNTQTILQNILAERNKLSKEIGLLKSQKKDADKIIAKVEKLKEEASTLKELEKIRRSWQQYYQGYLTYPQKALHRVKMKKIICFIESGEVNLVSNLNLKNILK